MASAFAWLDSSEHERRRALDIIDLFGQSETVDELGLGTVRDAIAEVLTPGTSTVQTRARYFFFIAWAYQSLDRKAPVQKPGDAARRLEIGLIEALKNSPDTAGTIGINSGPALQRLPSTIYWAGLGRLGFRLFQGSIEKYHRMLERGWQVVEADDSKDYSGASPFKGNWHPHLPAQPRDFPGVASFALSRVEAEFFKEQLQVRAPGSMLTYLVDHASLLGDVDCPWMHPDIEKMPSQIRVWLADAQNYSELMSGAQYLYNLMLAQAKEWKEEVENYEKYLDDWARTIRSKAPIYTAWDRIAFWQRVRRSNPRLPEAVKLFSETWITMTLRSTDPGQLAKDPTARRLVEEREAKLKGSRARLRSRTHLDLWNGASGAEPLNYRWNITRRVVEDIVEGLKHKVGTDA
jgi:hypothetical protein